MKIRSRLEVVRACVLGLSVFNGGLLSETLHAAPALNLNLGNQTIAMPSEQSTAIRHVTISGPNGFWLDQRLSANATELKLSTAQLSDGDYHYRVQFEFPLSASEARMIAGDLNGGERFVTPQVPTERSGSFRVQQGQVVLPDTTRVEETDKRAKGVASAKDQVIPDDLIVQGSGCFGFDCVNNESFGFDTIRLKENNTRIKFEDTSTGAFPADDWQLTANDSASGGANKFSIDDITGAKTPFTVIAGAANNSLFIDSTGRLGLRTATPVLDLQINTTNTPGLRLEQNNSGGFTAQTWDVASNEANFFVRDVTGGSRLPFRIRPGAPTSSIDIAASGNVGIGTASPASKLHVESNSPAASPVTVLMVRNSNGDFGTEPTENDIRFMVDSSGNVSSRGVIAQQSSRASKTDFQEVDAKNLLNAIASLDVLKWRYKEADATDVHLGPMAETFYEAFGLGQSNRVIAPSDLAGVALAAVQALQIEIKQRDQTILDLETRLKAIEQRLQSN